MLQNKRYFYEFFSVYSYFTNQRQAEPRNDTKIKCSSFISTNVPTYQHRSKHPHDRKAFSVPINLFLCIVLQSAFDIFLLKTARIIEVVAWGGELRGVTYIPVNTPAQSTLATGTQTRSPSQCTRTSLLENVTEKR